MPRIIQPSFARGELGSDLWGRVDVSAYSVALRTAINCIIHAYGGVSNRAGLLWVGPCATHTGTPPALIEFEYNTSDTYILEFGELYMRVIRGDSHILEAAVAISGGVTGADPGVVTAAAHGYSDGDDVYIVDVVGMSELNQRWFTVANKTTNTFELTSQQTGASIDTSGFTAYASGGTVSRVYEVVTPYALADVKLVKHVQSANVMTLTHPGYPPQKLTRTDHDAWTMVEITFAPVQVPPAGLQTVATSGSGTLTYYQVTATNPESEEESLPGFNTAGAVSITAVTQASPAVVTTSGAHGMVFGDPISIDGIVGMVELNGRRFTVGTVTSTTLELLDLSKANINSAGYAAWSSGGDVTPTFDVISGAAAPNNAISWTAATDALKYSVYRRENGLYAWIGDTEALTFQDNNLAANLALSPPEARNPFLMVDDYPGVPSYYQQRKLFGKTNNRPDTTFYSVTGSEDNMTHSSPRQADDAITATLNSLQVNEIRAFVPLGDLLVFTSGSEWKVDSGQETAFSAETLRQKPQSNWGSSHLAPILVGDKVLFNTENKSYVRSLGYEITVDGYSGNDMTVFAPHIFEQYPAVDWAFTRWPDPIINIVRADGWAACFTFNPEQEVVAWTRWNTEGKFLRVASTRPSADSVDLSSYFVVERTIGGQSAFYIERTHSRRFFDVRDCFFVDAGLTADMPITITGATAADPVVITATAHGLSDGDIVDLSDIEWQPNVSANYTKTQPDQLNSRRYQVASSLTNTFELVKTEGRVDITAATEADPIVVTSIAHGLADGDVIGVFNVAGMVELNGNTYKVASKTDDTFELTDLSDVDIDSSGFTTYTSGGTLYPAEDGTAFNAYKEGGFARLTFTILTGLWHLEGEEIVVLADGNVVSGLTVYQGSVTIDRSSRAHAGKQYISDIETLDPELTAGGGTIQGKQVRVPSVTIRMKDSRGLLAGPNEDELTEMKQREFETYGSPTALLTGDKDMEITPDWDGGGRVFIRQVNPLPLTITAIIPYLDIGDEAE